MSSLIKRCQRRWSLRLSRWGDSKISPYWRRRDVRTTARSYGEITADGMVQQMAEENAHVDYREMYAGTTYDNFEEFRLWYRVHQAKYESEARRYLDEGATTDEIDDAIETEIDHWEA